MSKRKYNELLHKHGKVIDYMDDIYDLFDRHYGEEDYRYAWKEVASNKLFDKLLATDKKGIFKVDRTPLIGYPTGFPTLDYINGYIVNVPDINNPNKIIERWVNCGLFSGTFNMVIGNSGVAKTTYCVQAGSHIIRPFDNGLFIHLDGEHSSDYSHIMKLNRFSPKEIEDKYVMPELHYIEDVYKMIVELAELKLLSDEYYYDTGHLDSFGKPVKGIVPTVILMDSLPTFQIKEGLKEGETATTSKKEMDSQTYNMRLAIAYNTFYKALRPVIYQANIIVLAINHIKEKPEMGFTKTQAKIQYLKTNESIPGGTGPIYLSQTLTRFVYKGKYTEEKHGFDGFQVQAQTVKSKTNRSDQIADLVFDYNCGFDPWLTLVKFADDNGLIQGRNPYSYLKSMPDVKFSTKNFRKDSNEQVQQALLEACYPYLYRTLGNASFDPLKEDNTDKIDKQLSMAYNLSSDVAQETEVNDIFSEEVK